MSFRKLKNASTFALAIGIGFFCIGIWNFMINPTETFGEKFGVVFMSLGGILIGMGFSIYIIWKIK